MYCSYIIKQKNNNNKNKMQTNKQKNPTQHIVKHSHVVTSIKQSPVLQGHFFLVLS
jgi:hypothetical protein